MRLQARYKKMTLFLDCFFIGKDVQVILHGGESHIGAVALAEPRPSLADDTKCSSTASVLAVSGHKEDMIARQAALYLARNLDVRVCVSCGIHFDALRPEDRIQLEKMALALCKECVKRYENTFAASSETVEETLQESK